MKPNNQPPCQKLALSTPTIYGISRNRLLSFNTPQLSPLKIVQSPYMNLGEGSLFDNQLNLYGEFRLEEGAPLEQNAEQLNQSSEESQVEEMEFPKFDPNAKVTKENMIEFLVDTINIDEDKIQKVKESFDQTGQPFLSQVFQYLHKRFKKSKKTKQEMIKYTMRKSFKFITDQMKKEDPSLIPLLSSSDGLEGMSMYFTKHSEDQQISIPFKKNSLQRTMNAAFLKKVFSCQRFYKDYKKFLKSFQNQFIKDNKKKINSMTESVKSCLNSKSYKSLQNYKRLPWTKDILMKLKVFAHELLSYSPLKDNDNRFMKDNAHSSVGQNNNEHKIDIFNDNQSHKNPPKRSGDSLNNYDQNFKDLINSYQDHQEEYDEVMEQLANKKQLKKKSVIILTPPSIPLASPKMPDVLNLQ